MFNRVQFVLSKRISQNKGYFILDGKKKRNNIKNVRRDFSTNFRPSPNGGDNFLKLVTRDFSTNLHQPSPNGGGDNFLMLVLGCGAVLVANSSGPPPPEVPYYFDWSSI